MWLCNAKTSHIPYLHVLPSTAKYPAPHFHLVLHSIAPLLPLNTTHPPPLFLPLTQTASTTLLPPPTTTVPDSTCSTYRTLGVIYNVQPHFFTRGTYSVARTRPWLHVPLSPQEGLEGKCIPHHYNHHHHQQQDCCSCSSCSPCCSSCCYSCYSCYSCHLNLHLRIHQDHYYQRQYCQSSSSPLSSLSH